MKNDAASPNNGVHHILLLPIPVKLYSFLYYAYVQYTVYCRQEYMMINFNSQLMAS